jgi:hypothetical protein
MDGVRGLSGQEPGEGYFCEARAHQAVLGCLRGVPYAYAVESDEPIVLQHSRLDPSAGAYGE